MKSFTGILLAGLLATQLSAQTMQETNTKNATIEIIEVSFQTAALGAGLLFGGGLIAGSYIVTGLVVKAVALPFYDNLENAENFTSLSLEVGQTYKNVDEKLIKIVSSDAKSFYDENGGDYNTKGEGLGWFDIAPTLYIQL